MGKQVSSFWIVVLGKNNFSCPYSGNYSSPSHPGMRPKLTCVCETELNITNTTAGHELTLLSLGPDKELSTEKQQQLSTEAQKVHQLDQTGSAYQLKGKVIRIGFIFLAHTLLFSNDTNVWALQRSFKY